MVNRVRKALWTLTLVGVVIGLNSCNQPQAVASDEERQMLEPRPLAGEGHRFQSRQCRSGERFESRYGDEARQALIVRYQGQEMTLRHHVHRDLVIYEGQSLALYSDGRVRQLVNAYSGQVLAEGCL